MEKSLKGLFRKLRKELSRVVYPDSKNTYSPAVVLKKEYLKSGQWRPDPKGTFYPNSSKDIVIKHILRWGIGSINVIDAYGSEAERLLVKIEKLVFSLEKEGELDKYLDDDGDVIS